MKQLSTQDQAYCQQYLATLRNANAHIVSNKDAAKERDGTVKRAKTFRSYESHGATIKSPGPDIVASPQLDQVALKTYSHIPVPAGASYEYEDNFLIFDRGGVLVSSRVFQMPENGGRLNYSCHLGHAVDWNTVVAAAHTHPLYKEKAVNRANRNFSAGDPTILLLRQIPLYLRTPEGKEIKVMEIRNNWVTTRRISEPGSKAKKWVMRG